MDQFRETQTVRLGCLATLFPAGLAALFSADGADSGDVYRLGQRPFTGYFGQRRRFCVVYAGRLVLA